ncbi:hypothetical protein ACE99V_004270, partial [Brevibacillus sp. H7]
IDRPVPSIATFSRVFAQIVKKDLAETLVIKHALCNQTRACLEGMIEDLTGVEKEKGKEKSQSTARKFPKETREERSRQICLFDVS